MSNIYSTEDIIWAEMGSPDARARRLQRHCAQHGNVHARWLVECRLQDHTCARECSRSAAAVGETSLERAPHLLFRRERLLRPHPHGLFASAHASPGPLRRKRSGHGYWYIPPLACRVPPTAHSPPQFQI
eukprot:3782960-Pleurochrysis_carterae.AAC.3